MASVLERARVVGVTHVIFGDLFLADLRAYREARLAEVGMTGVFPLWMEPTRPLAAEMIRSGLKATVTCIDPRKLERTFASRTFDADFVASLPSDVDPCGENGEFHTFAWAGPMFAKPIDVVSGEVVERDGFVFADVLPV
jgi:diphthamide synthase (EF-2-diphthine--ammonia ligase)